MIRTAAIAAIVAGASLGLAGCSGDPAPEPTASPSAPAPSASAAALDDRPLDEQLLEAVQAGDIDVVILALDAGADPDAAAGDVNQNTAFSLAITRDDSTMVDALLDAGATIENTETGFSDLTTAAQHASVEVVVALLDAGADPDGLPPLQGLPLAGAAYEGNIDVMVVLLEAGADPNVVVEDEEGFGYTPLFSAAFGGSREAADVLLQWGADPAWEAVDRSTAGGWAAGQGHRELGDYLDGLVSSEE